MTETIKLSDIEVLPQPRKDFSAVPMIADSIAKNGLLVPLLVAQKETSGSQPPYVLIDGEQRYRALQKLGINEAIVHFIGAHDEQARKEVQMTANLCRFDLAPIERMRGFAELLKAAPEKYNALTVARKFGYKEKEIRRMVSLAEKILPVLDKMLASGAFDEEDLENLAKIPLEYQGDVMVEAAKKAGSNVQQAIFKMTEELHFDDVFKEEQAKAEGKIHYQPEWGNPRTFDKAYAKKVQEEFEVRTKKKYSEERAKSAGKKTEQKELTLAQAKKQKEKKAENLQAALLDIKSAVPAFLQKKPDMGTAHLVIKRYLWDMSGEDLKMLLRAFEVEFKASEVSKSDLTNLFNKQVLQKFIKEPAQALNFVAMLDIGHSASTTQDVTGLKIWVRGMRKTLGAK